MPMLIGLGLVNSVFKKTCIYQAVAGCKSKQAVNQLSS